MDEINEEKNSNLGGCILVAVVIVLLFIIYNDFISIPKKNREYLQSCYYLGFTVHNSGEQNDYKRELFWTCMDNVDDLSIDKAHMCWKSSSPETLVYSSEMQICANKLYEDSKLLF